MLRRASSQCRKLVKSCSRSYPVKRCYPSRGFVTAPQQGDRVVVAMSGGVDSSLTARLLAEEDYDLSAVFMHNWDTRDESATDTGCEWEKDWEDVQHVCRHIGIPCTMIDLSREYWTRVFEPALQRWEAGETPNPDIWCNREVKFGALYDRVLRTNGAQWLATGHYAGIEWDYSWSVPRAKLVQSSDETKDQTYYLSGVKESSFRQALFPLKNLTKREVRELATKYGLSTSRRKESMGICFVGEKRKFDNFLGTTAFQLLGYIRNWDTNEVIAVHQGLWQYTVGQHVKIPNMAKKMFVMKKHVLDNVLYVVPGSNHPALYNIGVVTRNFHWIWGDAVPQAINTALGLRARVKIRHRMNNVWCTVRNNPYGKTIIEFDEPQHAVAAGQVAAVYNAEGRWCLGSGEISEAIDVDFHAGQTNTLSTTVDA